jgi:superfamily II DNA or RNA helicase
VPPPTTIRRFSSRLQPLDKHFLAERLRGAKSYRRIAGYFRSSIFELVGEAISAIKDVRIVCNSDLDPRDILVSRAVRDARLKEKWNELSLESEALLHRESYRRLYELLTTGNVKVKVVPVDRLFLHGKAGLIEQADGTVTSFIGSVNETRRAFSYNYEIVWEDSSPEAVKWVEEEFEALWQDGVDLPEAIILEIKRLGDREEISLEDCDELNLPAAMLAEAPIYRSGEQLQPWQRAFVVTFMEHRQKYGGARLLLADEVGVGKTLSLATSAILSALLDDGPVLILCPSTLAQQWQVELHDQLGVPSAVWLSNKKMWLDPAGHSIRTRGEADIVNCPYRIAIVSTGLIFHRSKERDLLLRRRYGTVVLDEAHRARRKGGVGSGAKTPNNLLSFMLEIGDRTRNLLLGTATPIQTEVYELWDLLRVLNAGQEFVLGRGTTTHWGDGSTSLVTGRVEVADAREAWDLIRNPLPPGSEHHLFSEVRNALDLPDDTFWTAAPFSSLAGDLREAVQDSIERKTNNLGFFQQQNPVVRHTVLRQRRVLEEMGLLQPVGVDVHPDPERVGYAYPGISFDGGLGLATNHFFERAYSEAVAFTKEVSGRNPAGGFLRTLLLQRLCSSFTAGLVTAQNLLEKRTADEDELPDLQTGALSTLTASERDHLENIIDALVHVVHHDPKFNAVQYFLSEHRVSGSTWMEHGCIIFSQYYDTARWVAGALAHLLPEEPVALYAGVGKSALYLENTSTSVKREEIKLAVRNRRVRLVVATDAAAEGLNLQTLGTLINIDLPWNPSRLEQRLGRIRRFGQARESVDMLNLIYRGTQDEKIYSVLSRRMRNRYDVFGQLPDVIDDAWIADAERLEEELEQYWARRQAAQNAFDVRHRHVIEPDNNRWELCSRVLARRDIIERLSVAW